MLTGKYKEKEKKFTGEIIEIYENPLQHYMTFFKIQTSNNIIYENAEIWSKSWEYAEIGDSIIKPCGYINDYY